MTSKEMKCRTFEVAPKWWKWWKISGKPKVECGHFVQFLLLLYVKDQPGLTMVTLKLQLCTAGQMIKLHELNAHYTLRLISFNRCQAIFGNNLVWKFTLKLIIEKTKNVRADQPKNYKCLIQAKRAMILEVSLLFSLKKYILSKEIRSNSSSDDEPNLLPSIKKMKQNNEMRTKKKKTVRHGCVGKLLGLRKH